MTDSTTESGRKPDSKLSLFPWSVSEYIETRTADNAPQTRRSFVISKRFKDKQGKTQYVNLTAFPSEIPQLRTLLAEIERTHLIRTERNDGNEQ